MANKGCFCFPYNYMTYLLTMWIFYDQVRDTFRRNFNFKCDNNKNIEFHRNRNIGFWRWSQNPDTKKAAK